MKNKFLSSKVRHFVRLLVKLHCGELTLRMEIKFNRNASKGSLSKLGDLTAIYRLTVNFHSRQSFKNFSIFDANKDMFNLFKEVSTAFISLS